LQVFHKRLTFLIGPEAQEIFFKASDDVLSQNGTFGLIGEAGIPHLLRMFLSRCSVREHFDRETKRFLDWWSTRAPDRCVEAVLPLR
jgi:hypothetical protein